MEPCLFAVDGKVTTTAWWQWRIRTEAMEPTNRHFRRHRFIWGTPCKHCMGRWCGHISWRRRRSTKTGWQASVWMFSDGTGTCQVWTTAKFQGWQNGGNCSDPRGKNSVQVRRQIFPGSESPTTAGHPFTITTYLEIGIGLISISEVSLTHGSRLQAEMKHRIAQGHSAYQTYRTKIYANTKLDLLTKMTVLRSTSLTAIALQRWNMDGLHAEEFDYMACWSYELIPKGITEPDVGGQSTTPPWRWSPNDVGWAISGWAFENIETSLVWARSTTWQWSILGRYLLQRKRGWNSSVRTWHGSMIKSRATRCSQIPAMIQSRGIYWYSKNPKDGKVSSSELKDMRSSNDVYIVTLHNITDASWTSLVNMWRTYHGLCSKRSREVSFALVAKELSRLLLHGLYMPSRSMNGLTDGGDHNQDRYAKPAATGTRQRKGSFVISSSIQPALRPWLANNYGSNRIQALAASSVNQEEQSLALATWTPTPQPCLDKGHGWVMTAEVRRVLQWCTTRDWRLQETTTELRLQLEQYPIHEGELEEIREALIHTTTAGTITSYGRGLHAHEGHCTTTTSTNTTHADTTGMHGSSDSEHTPKGRTGPPVAHKVSIMFCTYLQASADKVTCIQWWLHYQQCLVWLCLWHPLDIVLSTTHGDIMCKEVQHKWLQASREGAIFAVVCGPPCESWSVARWHDDEDYVGPKPLRSGEDVDHSIWALTILRQRDLRQVDTANQLLLFSLMLFVTQMLAGAIAIIEQSHLSKTKTKRTTSQHMAITFGSILAYSCGSGQFGYMAGTFQLQWVLSRQPCWSQPQRLRMKRWTNGPEGTAHSSSYLLLSKWGLRLQEFLPPLRWRDIHKPFVRLLRKFYNRWHEEYNIAGQAMTTTTPIFVELEELYKNNGSTHDGADYVAPPPKNKTLIRCTHPQMAVS